ncbi:MAG: peptide deformylase [Pseudomonadota bacterium]
MPARPILRWPAPLLRKRAAAVDAITDDIRAIWADMVDTMEAMPGIGLAAPQIGVGLRLAVVDASRERGRAIKMANPEIIHASTEAVPGNEASPCLPGVSAKIVRPRAVTVRFLNEAGQIDRRELVLQWARSVQHQIDHLDGKLYVSHLSRTKRDMLLKKSAKATA